jgi:hypothetical protein
MWRAYQSPAIGTDCGPQCAQMPSLASRNHSGHLYCLSDSNVAANGPGAMAADAVDGVGGAAGPGSAAVAATAATSANAADAAARNGTSGRRGASCWVMCLSPSPKGA